MKQNQEKPIILVVDDTSTNIDVIKELLPEDYLVQAATSGAMALQIIERKKPDLILLDVMMPGMDGHQVCQQLKNNPATAAIPVIFVTAKSDVADETYGFSLGAVDYITKPISAPVVLARVKTHLKLRQMQVEMEQKNLHLEEASRLRDDVERITQHDLKSPLNNIIASPAILAEKYAFSDEDSLLLKGIERSGHKMLNMINRSLDLYKMETGSYKLKAESTDLLPTLQSILNEASASPLARGKSAVLRLNGKPPQQNDQFWAKAEEMLCYPMFSNLILNAFEASPDGASVEIDMQTGDSHATIQITNQGAVPESIQETFFDKYVTKGKDGGTGIGTYSARLCAETQQGTIALESLEQERTRIIVTLPVMKKGITLEELRAQFANPK